MLTLHGLAHKVFGIRGRDEAGNWIVTGLSCGKGKKRIYAMVLNLVMGWFLSVLFKVRLH